MEFTGKLVKGFIEEEELERSNEELRGLVDVLLEKGILCRGKGGLTVLDRIALVEFLLSHGFTVENLASLLTWRDFEAFSEEVFTKHGYSSLRNFRFSQGKRRFEVDLLALKKPLLLCVECKHYRRPRTTMLSKQIIERHMERVKALAESMPSLTLDLGVSGWGRVKVLPLIITLTQEGMYRRVPIVPVFKLNAFLLELDLNMGLICSLEAETSNYLKLK